MNTIKQKEDTGREARVSDELEKMTNKSKNNPFKVWFCNQCPCYMMQLLRGKGVNIFKVAPL